MDSRSGGARIPDRHNVKKGRMTGSLQCQQSQASCCSTWWRSRKASTVSHFQRAWLLWLVLGVGGFVPLRGTSIASLVPETPARGRQGQAASAVTTKPYAGRFVVPLSTVAGARRDYELNASYVRVTSKLPVSVYFDGDAVSRTMDQDAAIGDLASYSAGAAGGIDSPDIRPGTDFTYFDPERPVKVISIQYQGADAGSFAKGTLDLIGDVWVHFGRGGMFDVGPGLPGSHAHLLTATIAPAAVFATIGPYNLTAMDLTNNNPTTQGFYPVPTRMELASVGCNLTWQGSAGNISTFEVGRYDFAGTFHALRIYHPNTASFTVEMSHPVIYENLDVRNIAGAFLGTGIAFFITATASFNFVVVDANWRYWM